MLIFYGWTAAVSIGCLLYFVLPVYFQLPTWYATIFLVIALFFCTVVTLAPLSRRKAVEAASQVAPSETLPSETAQPKESAQRDPLDETAATAVTAVTAEENV